jgi:hypothetical protein
MAMSFVAVGSVPAGSVQNYNIVISISGGTVPDVRATLTLPPQVQYIDSNMMPTSQPASGASGGVVTWAFGDLTVPGNISITVRGRIRADLAVGTTFTSKATASNGRGQLTTVSRISRVSK